MNNDDDERERGCQNKDQLNDVFKGMGEKKSVGCWEHYEQHDMMYEMSFGLLFAGFLMKRGYSEQNAGSDEQGCNYLWPHFVVPVARHLLQHIVQI